MTGSGDREPRYCTRGRHARVIDMRAKGGKKKRKKGGSILLTARTETHLWGNYFDELVEEAELAHLAVKPFAAALHARLQNLRERDGAGP